MTARGAAAACSLAPSGCTTSTDTCPVFVARPLLSCARRACRALTSPSTRVFEGLPYQRRVCCQTVVSYSQPEHHSSSLFVTKISHVRELTAKAQSAFWRKLRMVSHVRRRLLLLGYQLWESAILLLSIVIALIFSVSPP